MSKEAMKLALEALEELGKVMVHYPMAGKAITALREALAEQPTQLFSDRVVDMAELALAEQPAQQEPLGFMNAGNILEMQQKSLPYAYVYPVKSTGVSVAVYTSPPAQRTWVGLTDAETEHLWEISRAAIPRYHTFKTLIEKALRERNT